MIITNNQSTIRTFVSSDESVSRFSGFIKAHAHRRVTDDGQRHVGHLTWKHCKQQHQVAMTASVSRQDSNCTIVHNNLVKVRRTAYLQIQSTSSSRDNETSTFPSDAVTCPVPVSRQISIIHHMADERYLILQTTLSRTLWNCIIILTDSQCVTRVSELPLTLA
jgi:hypothetical protein